MNPDEIDRLIEKYGQPAFDLAMRQVQIDIWMGIVMIGLCTVAAVVLLVFARRQWRLYRSDKNKYYLSDINAQGLGLCALVPSLFGLISVAETVSKALNPAWAALQKLLP